MYTGLAVEAVERTASSTRTPGFADEGSKTFLRVVAADQRQ